ncbi:MAG: hypothetical protein C4310_01145 [Chloroflexota bacterium]
MGLRGGRGRTTALVAAAVLVLLVGAVWARAQATWATPSPPPRPSLPSTGLSSTGLSSTGLQPGWQGDWPSGMDYVSAALKFGLVLLLLYGALWALRRYARTGFVRGATDSRRLALLETMPLAPRQVLHLVRADDRTLLLGASERGIVFLADLTAPMDDGRAGAGLRPASTAPSPLVGESWGGEDSFTPSLSLPHQRGGDMSLLQSEGIARLASAFAQHLRQAIQRREHHAA